MPTNFAIVGAPILDAKSGPLDKQQVDYTWCDQG